MSLVGSYESFIRERVSSVITCHLGNLGVLGVPVLEIKELHPLHPRIGEEVRKRDKSTALIRKDFEIVARTSGGSVHFW